MDKEALFAAFGNALPTDTAVDRRKMFGYPCAFCNGNMFAGVHEANIVVRLGPAKQAELMGLDGARPFVTMGRTMREYTCLPPSIAGDGEALSRWLDEGFRYAVSLPAKEPRPRKAPRKTGGG